MVYTLSMQKYPATFTTSDGTALYQKMERDADAMQEKHDCAVKALAVVAGMTYKGAHSLLEQVGRKPQSSTQYAQTIRALKLRSIKTQDVTRRYRDILGAKTVRTLSRVMVGREGAYLAFTRDHLVAIKDGAVHCWSHDHLYRVVKVVKLQHLTT